MADVDLEAEQVVGEEEEAPPKKRGLPVRKNVVVFSAILVLEAVLLFFIFNLLASSSSEADASTKETKGPDEKLASFDQLNHVRKIDLGGISIYDESDTQRGAARRYTVQCAVWIKAETFTKIESINEANPDALEFVKDELRRTVKQWMLRNGGMSLRSLDMQHKAGDKIKAFINDELAPLRDQIVNVTFEEFRPSKW